MPPEDPALSLGATLLDALRRHAAAGVTPCQVDAQSGAVLSFAEFLKASVRAALGLRQLGLRRGDILAFYSRNRPELFPVLAGAIMEGVTTSFINAESTESELSHCLSLLNPRALLSQPGVNSPVARRAAGEDTILLETNDETGNTPAGERRATSVQALLALAGEADPDLTVYEAAIIPNRDEHEAIIMFSSGTSGLPKAVAHSNAGVQKSCQASRYERLWYSTPGYCHLISNQLSWITGSFATITNLIGGASRVVANYTNSVDMARILERHRANYWILATPYADALSVAVQGMVPRPDLSSVAAVVIGGVSISAERHARMQEFLGIPCPQVFGSTEMGLMTHDCDPVRPGSCGRPVPGVHIRVVDVDSGLDVTEPGALGEARIGMECGMKRYLGAPELTAAAFDQQGYFRTGDLVYLDADGYLFIVDRIKELLKYNGRGIAPAQIERELLSHPAVRGACVVGRPHPEHGDVPTAFVALAPDSHVTEEELQAIVADRLSDFKRLRGGVYFEKELLKTPNGKINRQAYKARLREESV